MIINELTLKQFRNHKASRINFDKGINVIIGKNGTGKTNIVEAIYFLSLARSFRTDDDKDLICEGCEFASVEGNFSSNDETKKIKIVLTPSTKKIICNGHEVKKISELTKLTNVISFKPSDVMIFDNSPSIRRKFLDISISKFDECYLTQLSLYDKLLKERNEILKQEHVDNLQLDVITEQMIDVEYEIVKKRKKFIGYLNEIINKVVVSLKSEASSISLNYFPFVKSSEESFKETAKKAYFDSLERDLKTKSTNIGIQREDFSTFENGRNIEVFGSQGQKRQIALALKLCPYFLYKDDERKPIVILDDVLSELDKANQDRLIRFVSHMEQVFITATNYHDQYATLHYVDDYKVTRR
ncbi:MAG: DNA replication and repair protein RecF [Bacilli bacterium]|nr:DNA replication and repair protein RecF [Bacilli bacterium]